MASRASGNRSFGNMEERGSWERKLGISRERSLHSAPVQMHPSSWRREPVVRPGGMQFLLKAFVGEGMAPEYQCACWKNTTSSQEYQDHGSYMQIGIRKGRKWRVSIFSKIEGLTKNFCLCNKYILGSSHAKACGSTVAMGMASVAGWPGFESWIRYVILGNAFSLPVSQFFSSENRDYNHNNSTDIK